MSIFCVKEINFFSFYLATGLLINLRKIQFFPGLNRRRLAFRILAKKSQVFL